MQVRVNVPLKCVDIVLKNVNRIDINELMEVLDKDRNADARRELYDALQQARVLLTPPD
jgi:hypothetical protein